MNPPVRIKDKMRIEYVLPETGCGEYCSHWVDKDYWKYHRKELFQERVNATVEKLLIIRYKPSWDIDEHDLKEMYENAINLHKFLDGKTKESEEE